MTFLKWQISLPKIPKSLHEIILSHSLIQYILFLKILCLHHLIFSLYLWCVFYLIIRIKCIEIMYQNVGITVAFQSVFFQQERRVAMGSAFVSSLICKLVYIASNTIFLTSLHLHLHTRQLSQIYFHLLNLHCKLLSVPLHMETADMVRAVCAATLTDALHLNIDTLVYLFLLTASSAVTKKQ